MLRKRFPSSPSKQQRARHLLRAVACANHRNGRREFTSKHVLESVDAGGKEIWDELAADGEFPFVKTLLEPGLDEGDGGEYQFKHLSLQEFLFADALAAGGEVFESFFEDGKESLYQHASDRFQQNVFLIGGLPLAQQITSSTWSDGVVDGRKFSGELTGFATLLCLSSSSVITLEGCGKEHVDPSAWKVYAAEGKVSTVQSLVLKGCPEIDDTCLGQLLQL